MPSRLTAFPQAPRLVQPIATLLILMGAAVLVAQALGQSASITQFIGNTPAAAISALGLLAGGCSQLATAHRRSAIARIAGLIVLACGVAALAMGVAQLDFRDSFWHLALARNVLMQFFSTGPMLILIAISLLILSRQRSSWQGNYVVSLTGGLALLLGTTSTLFNGLTPAWYTRYAGWLFGGFPPYDIIGFILLGGGLILLARDRRASGMPRILQWLAMVTVTVLVSLSLIFWGVLESHDLDSLNSRTTAQSLSMSQRFETALKERINSLERMARRWELAGGTSREIWEHDSRAYLRDMPDGLIGINWLSPQGQVQWSFNIRKSATGLDYNADLARADLLEKARQTRQPVFSSRLELKAGGPGLLLLRALYVDNSLDGYLVGVFDIDALMHKLSAQVLERGYAIHVSSDGNELYRHGELPSQAVTDLAIHTTVFDLGGHQWRLRLWPDTELLDTSQSHVPEITLLSGLALAFFTGAVFWLWERSRLSEIAKLNTQAQVARLLELLPDGVMTLDARSTLPLNFNSAAHRQLGYDEEEFRVIPVSAYENHGSERPIRQRIDALHETIHDEFETMFRRKDDSLMHVHVSIVSMEEQDGTVLLVLYRNIDTWKQTQQRLLLQSIALEQSPSPIIITDLKGDILYANKSFTAVSGYPLAEVLGRNPRVLRSGLTPRHTYTDMWKALTSGQAWSGELINRRKTGEIYWVESHVSPVTDASGTTTHYVATQMDITERKLAAEQLHNLNISLEQQVEARTRELVSAKEQAIDASHAKSQFLSNMSHEIRTPLNSVLGMTYLALKSGPAGKQREYLEKIHLAAEHLLAIINDILDYSKIEAGMLRVTRQRFRMAELDEHLQSLFAEKAAEKGLAFRVRRDPAVPEWVRGDPLRLKQILINLTDNAIKFTKQGSVTVSIEVAEHRATDCLLHFAVQDTGIGIRKQDQALLFEYFHQTDASVSREYGGTGLGLAISHRLVDLMAGEIGVQSTPGEGSTFWFRVPLALDDDADLTQRHDETDKNPSGVLEGTRVLLVEDNEFSQDVAAGLLARAGVTVAIANDGIEALDTLRTESFDCVLMDIQMPRMDGLEATRQIRADPALNDVYIIAMTANASAQDLARATDVGINEFLVKPVNPDRLYTALLNSIRSASIESGQATASPQPMPNENDHPPDNDPDVIDFRVLAQHVGENYDALHLFAVKFLDAARQGLAEMDNALTSDDRTQLAAVAHRIKSPARTVGATRFAAICQTIEEVGRGAASAEAAPLVNELHVLLASIQANIEHSFVTSPKPATEVRHASTLRVLIVDDEPFQHSLLTNALEKLHITQISHALHGAQALALLAPNLPPPDVIICDLDMPDVDGIALLRHLARQHYQGGIIVISGAEPTLIRIAERLATIHGLTLLGSVQKPAGLQDLARALAQMDAGPRTSKTPSSSAGRIPLQELQRALAQGEIQAWFQPKVAIDTRRVTGAECLARWQHPTRGLLTPGSFVALAEDHDLIHPLTLTIFEQAAACLADWRAQGHELKLAINVSVEHLRHIDLPEVFDRQVRAAGLTPRHFILELTESRLMEDLGTGLDIIARLRLKGFGLSIDDFGTGFSTLENLKQLPFTELKIDRAFVRGAAGDTAASAILTSSIELAHAFDLNIVAEGVETLEDWEYVASLGCHEIQGYYIARPMPAQQFIQWLGRYSGRNPAASS